LGRKTDRRLIKSQLSNWRGQNENATIANRIKARPWFANDVPASALTEMMGRFYGRAVTLNAELFLVAL
jgi:hypothetical protein